MDYILLVEDNPAHALLFTDAIQTASIQAETIVAQDGIQAKRILSDATRKPALIVLDLNIPRLNGLEFLDEPLEQLGIPVVVLSSSENPEDKKRAFVLGARDFITKPVSREPFIAEVHKMVNKWLGRRASTLAG